MYNLENHANDRRKVESLAFRCFSQDGIFPDLGNHPLTQNCLLFRSRILRIAPQIVIISWHAEVTLQMAKCDTYALDPTGTITQKPLSQTWTRSRVGKSPDCLPEDPGSIPVDVIQCDINLRFHRVTRKSKIGIAVSDVDWDRTQIFGSAV